MAPDTDAEWLSTAAAAKRLGITPRTLYRFIDEGQVPAFRFGRVIRLKTADVDRYIEDCRIEPGTMAHLYPETVRGSAPDEDESGSESENGDGDNGDDE